MVNLSTLELASRFPEVFQTLPEPYQNDNCLTFSYEGGCWFADHDMGGSYMLVEGEWIEGKEV